MADADQHAVSQLFREHNRVLVGYLTARLRSEQEAKEVAQEAYVRVLQLQEPRSPGLLRAYLFKIANNLAIDRLRHRGVRYRAEQQPEFFERPTGELDDPARQLLAREQAEQLLGYLGELPIKCQDVFRLHRFEGVAQHEVVARRDAAICGRAAGGCRECSQSLRCTTDRGRAQFSADTLHRHSIAGERP